MSNRRLIGEVRGEIETEEGVLVIRRIHVTYCIRATEDLREVIERVHKVHAPKCPVYRTLHRAIEITTDYFLEEGA